MQRYENEYGFWCDYENFGKVIGDDICSTSSIINIDRCNKYADMIL